MSGSGNESVQAPGGDGVLDFNAVRVFNRHLQSWKHSAEGCADCSAGLEGIISEVPRDLDKPSAVAEGDGTDEGGNPAPSRSDGGGPDGRQDQLFSATAWDAQ